MRTFAPLARAAAFVAALGLILAATTAGTFGGLNGLLTRAASESVAQIVASR